MHNVLHRWYLMAGLLVATLLLLTACSGEGFHLRGSVELPKAYQRVYLQSTDTDKDFRKALERSLEEAGSELVTSHDDATAVLVLSDYKEGKKVAGYGTNREVREYLIFLRFDFETKNKDGKVLLPPRKINVDKIQIYDSAFVLGKIEEERLIREDLRKNAAQQIVLRLRYGQ